MRHCSACGHWFDSAKESGVCPHQRVKKMNVPIEDAVTIAYVGIIHAMSEVYEAAAVSRGMSARQALKDALEDLVNARDILKPHMNIIKVIEAATPEGHCLDCGKSKSAPGVPAICAAWHDPDKSDRCKTPEGCQYGNESCEWPSCR